MVALPISAFVLVMLIFASFSVLSQRQDRQHAHQHLEQFAQDKAISLQHHLTDQFRVLHVLRELAQDPASNSQFNKLAAEFTKSQPPLLGVLKLDSAGKPLHGEPQHFFADYRDTNFSTDPEASVWLNQAVLSERLTLSSHNVQHNDKAVLLTFLTFNDRQDLVNGYIFAAFDIQLLLEHLQQSYSFITWHVSDTQQPLTQTTSTQELLESQPHTVQAANRVWELRAFAAQSQLLPNNHNPMLYWLIAILVAALIATLTLVVIRKQSATAHRAEELVALISKLPGMAFRLEDRQTWTMSFVSQGSLELTGYHPQQLSGVHAVSFEKVIDPRDHDNLHSTIDKAIQSNQTYCVTYRINTADGREKWVQESGCGLYRENGDLEAIEGFIFDVSKHVYASESLRRQCELLEETVSQRTQEFLETRDKLQQTALDYQQTQDQLNSLLNNLEQANDHLKSFAQQQPQEATQPQGKRKFLTWLKQDLGGRFNSKDKQTYTQLQQRVALLVHLIDEILSNSSADDHEVSKIQDTYAHD